MKKRRPPNFYYPFFNSFRLTDDDKLLIPIIRLRDNISVDHIFRYVHENLEELVKLLHEKFKVKLWDNHIMFFLTDALLQISEKGSFSNSIFYIDYYDDQLEFLKNPYAERYIKSSEGRNFHEIFDKSVRSFYNDIGIFVEKYINEHFEEYVGA